MKRSRSRLRTQACLHGWVIMMVLCWGSCRPGVSCLAFVSCCVLWLVVDDWSLCVYGQDDLVTEQEKSLERAILAASPRSAAQGEGEGGAAHEKTPPTSRRRAFVHRLTVATEEVYEVRANYPA